MGIGPLALLSLVGIPLLLGAAVLGAVGIRPRTDRIAYAGWAWMVGALGTGLVLFAWLWAGPDVHSAGFPAALLLVAAVLVHVLGRRLGAEALPAASLPTAPRWEVWLFRAALLLVLAVTIERIANASLYAVVATDEGNFWAHRAKLLFHAGGFGPDYAAAVETYKLQNADYPLLDPLLQLWVFVHAGEITHTANRIPIQLYSVALVLALAGGLRRLARPGVAALLLLLLPAMREIGAAARLAYADVLVALGLLVALDAALRWRADRGPGWIGLGSVGTATLLWSKHEGALIACALLAAAALERFLFARGESLRAEPARARLWLLPPAVVVAITWAVNAHFQAANQFMMRRGGSGPAGRDLEGSFVTQFVEQLPERLGPTLRYFLERVLLEPSHSQLLLLVVPVLFLLAPRTIWRSALRFPALVLAFALAGFVSIFIGLPKDLDYHLSTAAARISFQCVPAGVLWVGGASSLAVSSGRSMPRLSYTLLVLLLAWRVVATVPETVIELVTRAPRTFRDAFTIPQEERITNELERIEELNGFPPGTFVSIHRALLEHVPEDGLVYAVVSRRDPDFTIARTWRLLFPRRFAFVHPTADEAALERLAERAGGFWILDLASVPELLEGRHARVAEGPGWSLWH